MDLTDIDLWDKDRFVEGVPHEWFIALREQAPVFWHKGDPNEKAMGGDGGPFWAVTGYDDVVTVNRDNATFSSAERQVFMWDPDDANLEQQRLLMLNMDPPMHTRYRRLINKGFTPRMVSELESTMRKRTRDIIDKVADGSECDFVVDVASELPLQVIADLMGVPQEDRHKLFDWSNRMIGAEDPEYGITQEMTQHASMELYAYAAELAEKKRADPKDDLISVLTHAAVDGEQLTGLEIDLFFLLLTVAGNETTRNLISHGLVALLEHPDELAKVRANRELLPSMVEEMLRWASPVMHFRRTAMRDVQLGGQQIKRGDKVVIWYISANRDEKAFKDPFKFDVSRTPNEHVAFGGGGPHFCLGANLARMEINVMFDEILDRLDDLELTAPVSRLRSNFINGLKHIPLKFTVKH
ncbi:MAG: cytochrome P450 [Acidimicrobiia bacterium]|nr:cytochrome P450 [Acidimicrobiia bacterium]